MSEPNLIASKTDLPVEDIQLHERLRPVSDAGVASILASIGEIGQLTNPIVVRQLHRPGGIQYRLLDGAHRLEAARQLGWQTVPVRVFECDDERARLMEIDCNLAGAELNALDTAVFLATRKAVYERLHPETRRGVAGGLARQGSASDIVSFAETTAEKFGISKRHVERMTAAGARLGPDEVRQLRLARRAVTLADLQVISVIGEAPERYEVVKLLATGGAASAAVARKMWLRGGNPLPKADPIETEVIALRNAWQRARKIARRRFVAEFFEELAPLVTEESAKRGDQAVYYNRALPFDESQAGDRAEE